MKKEKEGEENKKEERRKENGRSLTNAKEERKEERTKGSKEARPHSSRVLSNMKIISCVRFE